MIVPIQLYIFLSDWLRWVDNGALHCRPFLRNKSLCLMTYDYANARNWSDNQLEEQLKHALMEEFNGDAIYPFNGDPCNFQRECALEACHENPERLSWVRQKVFDYEQENA